MKRTRHSPEQIIAKLREADAMLGTGAGIGQVCQKLGISEQTFHRWRNQYGGMKASEAKRLKELELENARLKKLVADLSLDTPCSRRWPRGNGESGTPSRGSRTAASTVSRLAATDVPDPPATEIDPAVSPLGQA